MLPISNPLGFYVFRLVVEPYSLESWLLIVTYIKIVTLWYFMLREFPAIKGVTLAFQLGTAYHYAARQISLPLLAKSPLPTRLYLAVS